MSDSLKLGDLIVRGPIIAQKSATDPATRRTSYTVQVMRKTGKDMYDLLDIKLFEGVDPTRFKVGDQIEVAVDISLFEGKLYYRATRDLLNRTTERPAPTPAAAKSTQ